MREALNVRSVPRSAAEPARLEGVGHELGGREVAARARRAGPGCRSRFGSRGRPPGAPSKSTSAASPCGNALGLLSNENIASTIASSAGTNAARYTRGSITAGLPTQLGKRYGVPRAT